MTANDRIGALRNMDAEVLCSSAETALSAFADIMNRETTLLRAGKFAEATELSSEKARIAQEYVGFARAVQDQATRLQAEAPAALGRLQANHEKLATQMAENLRILATAHQVTHNILTDVATSVGQKSAPQTYGASGKLTGSGAANLTKGIAFNQAL